MTASMFPLVDFNPAELPEANALLRTWQHKMGPLHRGNQMAICHVLSVEGRPVALTTASTLIAPVVGGADGFTRENTIELSRLCAAAPGWCRVVLRLWTKVVFPKLNYRFAVSYQDADLHNGNTYRFDGWRRVGFSHSGTDTRSGRAGRDKYVWVWEGA